MMNFIITDIKDILAIAISKVFLGVITVFTLMLLTILTGIAVGFVVGLFFEDTIKSVFLSFGFDLGNISMWQLGGTLGFVGGFFKSNFNQSKD